MICLARAYSVRKVVVFVLCRLGDECEVRGWGFDGG